MTQLESDQSYSRLDRKETDNKSNNKIEISRLALVEGKNINK